MGGRSPAALGVTHTARSLPCLKVGGKDAIRITGGQGLTERLLNPRRVVGAPCCGRFLLKGVLPMKTLFEWLLILPPKWAK